MIVAIATIHSDPDYPEPILHTCSTAYAPRPMPAPGRAARSTIRRDRISLPALVAGDAPSRWQIVVSPLGVGAGRARSWRRRADEF
jgi:hypothetical protein